MLPVSSVKNAAKLGACVAALGSALSLGHDFVGPLTCQGCHAEAYAAWSATPHATNSLTGTSAADPRCTSCHSPNETTEKVAGVSCETCHGGGQFYANRQVMRDAELARLVGLADPGDKTCRSCHDDSSPSLAPFVLRDKLKLIDHWSAERKRRLVTQLRDSAAHAMTAGAP